ncbi:MAG: hypothetical protein CMF39_06185 [Legionellaceae bacterium]|nr:hypothetical protein [Legionellaceae bacterium]|tara:strand:- start:50 stop:289 length:240 start_codon:yes stop_codon:yes gene_type:complete
MGRIDKIINKMRNNPRDWRIEDLKTVANRLGVVYRQPGTSHVTFRTQGGRQLTVPARKPIKPIYIKKFVELIDTMGDEV